MSLFPVTHQWFLSTGERINQTQPKRYTLVLSYYLRQSILIGLSVYWISQNLHKIPTSSMPDRHCNLSHNPLFYYFVPRQPRSITTAALRNVPPYLLVQRWQSFWGRQYSHIQRRILTINAAPSAPLQQRAIIVVSALKTSKLNHNLYFLPRVRYQASQS